MGKDGRCSLMFPINHYPGSDSKMDSVKTSTSFSERCYPLEERQTVNINKVLYNRKLLKRLLAYVR